MGPDERVYMSHAHADGHSGFTWRECIEVQARAYLKQPAARDFPSPIRWGWALCLRVTPHAAYVFAWACLLIAPIAGTSALLWHLASRKLQDTAVAFATCACVLAAQGHHPVALACAFAGLLALKPEGAALAVPAIAWASGGTWVCAPLMIGAFAWACATVYVFRGEAWPLVRALAQPHDNAYGREHQRGMVHRLFIDLAIVSPGWMALALWWHPASLLPALTLVLAHASTPVRNVRTVLAADLLMRAAVVAHAFTLGREAALACAGAFALDVFVARRVKRAGLYDTPTSELVRAVLKGAPRW